MACNPQTEPFVPSAALPDTSRKHSTNYLDSNWCNTNCIAINNTDGSTNDFTYNPTLKAPAEVELISNQSGKSAHKVELTGCLILWKRPSMMYSLSLPCGAIGLLTKLLDACRCSNVRKVASSCWTATAEIWKVRFERSVISHSWL